MSDPLACEDCGEPVPKNRRRRRCKLCSALVCPWCLNHVHNVIVQGMHARDVDAPRDVST